ncbi:MAG: N-acetyl-D-Glu racemase DgcA [Hyphomicrobiaceae bacterium]|nr:N-acetyl-D-Glu racemase DgcA [Hyphomicrobiaceae bacterium]
MVRIVDARIEAWPLAKPFVISRGAKTEARVVVVEVADDAGHVGRGEAVPYARYGETPEDAVAVLQHLAATMPTLASDAGVSPGPFTQTICADLPPGAARNALDCALWDLAAKRSGVRAHVLAGVDVLAPVVTCYTLSLDTPDAMARAARDAAGLPLLKLKLGGGPDDAQRLRAVRAARPDARLVADANEAWGEHEIVELVAVAAEAGFELIEQPLPAGADASLADFAHAVPICADESCHLAADLPAIAGRYEAINIKLDKAGGLTHALDLAKAARTAGLHIMVGSMVATSLAVAPALILAQGADWVDLDGPLLVARDRPGGIVIRNGVIEPPRPELWG